MSGFLVWPFALVTTVSEPFLGGAKLRFLNTLHSALDSPQMRVTLLTKPACLGLLEADHSWTESWQGRENQPRIYFPCVQEATALFSFRMSWSARCGVGVGWESGFTHSCFPLPTRGSQEVRESKGDGHSSLGGTGEDRFVCRPASGVALCPYSLLCVSLWGVAPPWFSGRG